ncbi:ABC transporter ATP-binding protein [Lysobacter gummosus]|jgi:lipopolysaccharide transport system ATP-binding protein|uniref:ABC transporter ATP-binding protein n=1 Tax=Lysobacter gummosus TaxID=262324 RepID=A0ABY3XCN4_9GAMM|nr:ABC transporter ATP-binding protein [Lysobacter gummosus]ALN93123.1 putative ATP binding component of ABC-transporter [Lysobacter gummosus]UNP28632.1 ABC transporter ATP-binding protein [Lysobacter gummosus]
MSLPVMVVENVGKAYVEYASELQRFARWFGVPVKPRAEHWVIRNVSFSVHQGESIGVIGQNGAGKSTLLKMITGTTKPSEGQVTVRGRVSALLELGLGFSGELTGRQNVVHAGGLMGLPQDQIEALMPQIEAFAEVGEYFDQPVRTYSSGMQMRVAFSIATAVRPDVLIVDEALSVGDTYFVHKCFKRIHEFRDAGTTLLIVSHDPVAIQALCDRAILLDGGKAVLDSDPYEVFDYYNALIAKRENSSVRTEVSKDGKVATESGTGEAEIAELQLLDQHGAPVEFIGVGQDVTLRARVRIHDAVDRLVFGYMIRDRLGQAIFGTNTHHTGQVREHLDAGSEVEYRVRFPANLGVGTYSFSVALTSAETHLQKNYQWRDLALVFTVANLDKSMFVGTAWIPPSIDVVSPLPAPRPEAVR